MKSASGEITKVLLIHNDERIRQILTELFKKRGYWVKVVGCAREGLEEVKKNPYHFAIIAAELPDMSGVELLEAIHKDNFKINCLMIAGYGVESKACLEKGAKAYQTRPLAIEQLLKIFGEKEPVPTVQKTA